MMRYLLLSLTVIIIDQLTKYLVRLYIKPFEAINILPFLHIVHIRNEGAAFGLFKELGNITFIVISIVAIVFILFVLFRYSKDRLTLSLILGGAIGNLIDRIIYGRVTDFIDFHIKGFHWPAFNIADSALTIGITFILLSNLKGIKKA